MGLRVQQAQVGGGIKSDPSGVTGADEITNIISLTQAEYDAITPDASTIYEITDAAAAGGIEYLSSSVIDITGSISHNFSIPAGVNKIEGMIYDYSQSAVTNCVWRLGDSGGIETTGYTASTYGGANSGTVSGFSDTTSFPLLVSGLNATGSNHNIAFTLSRMAEGSNKWLISGQVNGPTVFSVFTGNKELSSELTTLQLLLGAGTIDNGEANLMFYY